MNFKNVQKVLFLVNLGAADTKWMRKEMQIYRVSHQSK